MHPKVENVELRGSRWRFIELISMRVLFFKGKVAKRVSYVKLPIRNQAEKISKLRTIFVELMVS